MISTRCHIRRDLIWLEPTRKCRVASYSTSCDISLAFILSTCWETVGFTIKASSNVTSVLQFVAFQISLDTQKHKFFYSRIQFIFFDTRVDGQSKYPHQTIVLSSSTWLNFQQSLPPIANNDNLFIRWLAYTNVSVKNDLFNCALDNKYRIFSSKAWFNSLATLVYFQNVKCISIPLLWPNYRNVFPNIINLEHFDLLAGLFFYQLFPLREQI